MIKQAKIILVSGVTITFKEEDEVAVNYFDMNNELHTNNYKDLHSFLELVSSVDKYKQLLIKHKLKSGEYMEYYLTREKITWAYYEEIKGDAK